MKIIITFLYLFILTSFITRTYGEAGVGIMGRLAVPDIFAAISIFSFTINILVYRIKILVPNILKIFYLLIIMFFLGIFTSLNKSGTIIELIILVFLSLIFLVFINTHKNEKSFLNLIFIIATASFLTSFVGIWDVFSSIIGLPRFFPRDPNAYNLAVSGFRNTGQAGAYVLITIAIIISVINSPLIKHYSRLQQLFFKISLGISIMFLFLTVKIAAYIGFLFGMLLFALKNKNIKTIVFILIFSVILIVLFNNLENLAPSLYSWMTFKIDDRLSGSHAGGFWEHNLAMAKLAFYNNLLFGSGIGGFAHSIYGKYEVHSTYFKLIGETGIVGTFGYLLFIFFVFKILFIKRKLYIKNPYANFLSNMQPFFVGFLISWAYTYHLRKREFWILMVVIFLANKLMKKYQKDRRRESEITKTKNL